MQHIDYYTSKKIQNFDFGVYKREITETLILAKFRSQQNMKEKKIMR